MDHCSVYKKLCFVQYCACTTMQPSVIHKKQSDLYEDVKFDFLMLTLLLKTEASGRSQLRQLPFEVGVLCNLHFSFLCHLFKALTKTQCQKCFKQYKGALGIIRSCWLPLTLSRMFHANHHTESVCISSSPFTVNYTLFT